MKTLLKQPGFTLTELLVVLCLTGITAGLVWWMFSLFTSRMNHFQNQELHAQEVSALDFALKNDTKNCSYFSPLYEGAIVLIQDNKNDSIWYESGEDYILRRKNTSQKSDTFYVGKHSIRMENKALVLCLNYEADSVCLRFARREEAASEISQDSEDF